MLLKNCILLLGLCLTNAFQIPSKPARSSALFATKAKGYEPKWVKKETMADKLGKADPRDVGLKGTIQVVFKSGNETCQTMCLPNQPVREAAIQAGQFIKYGCGKGECGTCEALCEGKYIRPCIALVPPAVPAGESYVISVKNIKSKVVSSGKFFSVKSFLLGFWNNVLGMVGMVTTRRAAKRNWEERKEYEDMIKVKTEQKREAKRLARLAQQDKK
jgi:hypothetical protein